MSNTTTVQTYYNDLAIAYDADRFGNSYGRYLHQQEVKLLTRLLTGRNGNTADLGCGTGRLTGFASTGVDFSAAMLEEAKKKWPAKDFILSDLTELPFPSDSMNTLFSFHVFMHLDQHTALAIFAEAERVLQPGGIFIFDFPSLRRRNLFSRKREGWHGSTAYDALKLEIDGLVKEKYYGLMLFPVHRLPSFCRGLFQRLDSLLCRTFLKSYASYQAVVFRKP